jgi:hypothetical protein
VSHSPRPERARTGTHRERGGRLGKRNDPQRRAREAASRARRTANAAAKPGRQPPSTQASRALVADLEAAGLTELAARARRLDFDDLRSRAPFPLMDLVTHLTAAGALELIERVKAGAYDATAEDSAAYYSTARGLAEKEQLEAELAGVPEPVLARFTEAMKRAGDDPRIGERLMNEAIAKIAERQDPAGEEIVDDDRHVDPAEVHPQVRLLIGATGPDGERLDTPEILACAELVGRTGGRQFELGWLHDEPSLATEKRGWYAHARYQGARLGVSDQPGPSACARAFALRLLDGAQCQHCKRLVVLHGAAGVYAHDRTLIDGRVWTAEQQKQAGLCQWRRIGVRWEMGCA